MPRGGTGQHMHYPPQFFAWLEHQLLMVDDYAYAGMDFRGVPDLPLPPGEQWTDVGKNLFFFGFFQAFMIFMRI